LKSGIKYDTQGLAMDGEGNLSENDSNEELVQEEEMQESLVKKFDLNQVIKDQSFD
jgi:predicted metalloendopeptidase